MVEHPVKLRGASFAVTSGSPTILQRTDQDFLPAILEELKRDTRRENILKSLPPTRETNSVLKLFQPVHRTFNVALVEAICDTFGQPRLDLARIDSAGLVVRRQPMDSKGNLIANQWEGWIQSGKKFQGWVRLRGHELDRDPDPARRPPELKSGHPEINRRLAVLNGFSEPTSESVARLFPAPPDVCQAAKRTLFFGLIPVVSSEISEAPSFPAFAVDDLVGHLHHFLLSGGPRPFPKPGSRLEALDPANDDLKDLVTLLRQLAIEFDAFGAGDAARALFRGLNEMELIHEDGVRVRAGDFLNIATKVLVEREFSPAEGATRMPHHWQLITPARANTLAQLVVGAMQARLAQVAAGQGRFDGVNRRYHIRAFIRVKGHANCPPHLVWSEPSEPFTIAPWFDNNGAPPAQITLPDVNDRNLLRKLKPNVAFVMPDGLFNLMQGKPDDLMKGSGNASGIGIQWICSFSIPIITLCAFIVLNIFLQLFDLIFRWLLYIKICLPLPKPK